MAAIKRSQANQRRQPESFHLYQQQQQQLSSSSSVSMVKVELQNLVLSILDDPIVSRVFGESGFRSCEIKLAILRPVHQLLRYSRYRGPPMFLCNLTGDSDVGRRGFSFPFRGFSGVSSGDDNCRTIGEVLVRNKGRNPLLVGVCANDALQSFCEIVERRKGGCALPVEIHGLNVIRIENDVSKFVNEDSDEGSVKLRFSEVTKMVESCSVPGVVICYGDLKELIGDDASVAAASFVVSELTKLLDLHGGKVWLIGSAATYEAYLKFLKRFPSVEKDWDLQLLPITSLRPAMGESYPRSSLMESFVPFGGFFSTSSDCPSPLGVSYQCLSRCHLCNEKCEQEVSAIARKGFTDSVEEQYHSSLPSWLQMTKLGTNRGLDVEVQAQDDGFPLSATVKGLQRKWDNICKRLHHAEKMAKKGNIYQVGSKVPSIVGFRVADDKNNADNHSSNTTNASSNASEFEKVASCMSIDTQNISRTESSIWLPGISETPDASFLPKTRGKTSESEDLSLSSADGHPSPPSSTSVTTDLGLGIYSASTGRELKKPTNQFDKTDFKSLYGALSIKISWQEEAVTSISRAISNCRTRNEKRFGASLRGDMWFTFLGPDSFGKKRVAISLAEILYGSRDNFICVDLSSQDGVIQLNGYDPKFRGKTVVDYIAEELSKKPLSVVFLENIDKADLLAQNRLSEAVRTGRFSDSHGREISISNTLFVTTSRFTKIGEILSYEKETSNYLEESILRAKGWPIQMVINTRRGGGFSNPTTVNKRKTIGTGDEIIESRKTLEMAKRPHKASNMNLDLNLPAEEIETHDTGNSELTESISANCKVWLEDFLTLVDETVVFMPFDFDKLAEQILKEVSECFHSIVGSKCLLEIESKVMEQILATTCLSENNTKVEDWVKRVFGRGFIEAQKRYNLKTGCYVVKLVACDQGPFFGGESFLLARIVVN
ncbi:hypothetical protein U1Q18_022354 [Sarracenia purpurea var. burkii]